MDAYNRMHSLKIKGDHIRTCAPARRAFSERILQRSADDSTFTAKVLFPDEPCFTKTGITNINTEHVWSHDNPHVIPSHCQQRQLPPTCGPRLPWFSWSTLLDCWKMCPTIHAYVRIALKISVIQEEQEMAALDTASHDGVVSTHVNNQWHLPSVLLCTHAWVIGFVCAAWRSVPHKKTGINSDVAVNTTASACPSRTGQATHFVRNWAQLQASPVIRKPHNGNRRAMCMSFRAF
jgi:hypothetical protein